MVIEETIWQGKRTSGGGEEMGRVTEGTSVKEV